MRITDVAIAVVLAVTVWSITPTAGKAPQPTVSINPLGMMATTTNLPVDPQWDQGTVFCPTECTTTRKHSAEMSRPWSLIPAIRVFLEASETKGCELCL